MMTRYRLCVVVLLIYVFGSTGCSADAAPNQPPTLTLSVGPEETYVVGEDVVRIRATAKDPDGDEVHFDLADQPERSELQTFQNSALFTWDPITSDVTDGDGLRLIFVAEDGQGNRTEQVVRLTILPGNGTPTFLTASSKLYDPTSAAPLTFDVEVRDDDSSQLDLTMKSDGAPAGAEFEQTGDKQGKFTWDPSVEQRQKRIHAVTFVADDGQTDPVSLQVTIILQADETGGGGNPGASKRCADAAIIHSPIGPQRSIDDYQIRASFADDAQSKYDDAYLFWTTDDAMNEDVDFNSAQMSIDGADLTASITNPVLSAGQAETFYYAICASDNDAARGEQGATTCVPGGSYYSFRAYSPDESGCVDDAVGGSFSSASTIPDTSWGTHSICGGASDFHKVTVSAGEVVDVYLTYPGPGKLDIKSFDDVRKRRENVSKSDCYGIAHVSLQAPASGEKTYFVQVDGADVPYQITAFRDQPDPSGCSDADLEPNDTATEATLIFKNNQYFDQTVICEPDDVDVFAFDVLAGDTIEALLEFTHADGDLDASLHAPSGADNVTAASYGVDIARSSDDNEQMTHTAEESGVYYLLVNSVDKANSYHLAYARTCSDDDAFGASNRSRRDAALTTSGDHGGLKVCSGQPDWYERSGFAGNTVLAEVTVEQGARASDVDFSVHDANGRIKTATANGNRLELEFTPGESAQYFYKVSTSRDMVYQLTLFD